MASYASIVEADIFLAYNQQWKIFSAADKQARLDSATQMIDLREYDGFKVVDAQPNEFPRDFGYFGTIPSVFSEQAQTKRTKRACLIQVEYDINRYGVAATEFSENGFNVTPRQEIFCHQAMQNLMEYMI